METISRIHLEDFEVANTIGVTEDCYYPGGGGYPGRTVEQEKLAVIRYTTDDVSQIKIPFSAE